MEIHTIYKDSLNDDTTVVLEIEQFMSIKGSVHTEFRVPFDKNHRKWGLRVWPTVNRDGSNYVVLSLANPKDTKNYVHARLRSVVIVDGDGNVVSEEKRNFISDYSTFRPGQGWGLDLIKRDKVEALLLVDGTLMVECIVSVAREIRCDVKNLFPIGLTGIQVDLKIENFMNCGRDLISETIVTPFDAQVRWKVHLYPHGVYNEDKGQVSIYFCKANEKNKEIVWFGFSILDSKENVAFSDMANDWQDFGQLRVGNRRGWDRFISREKIQSILVNGNLHLRIYIMYNGCAASEQASPLTSGEQGDPRSRQQHNDFMEVSNKLIKSLPKMPVELKELLPRNLDSQGKLGKINLSPRQEFNIIVLLMKSTRLS